MRTTRQLSITLPDDLVDARTITASALRARLAAEQTGNM